MDLTQRRAKEGVMCNRRSGRFAVARGAIALAFIAAPGCDKPPAAGSPPPPAVTVTHPIQREVIEWDEYTGRLEAVETVELRARVSGFIEKADFQEGSL